jgi:serine protease Do
MRATFTHLIGPNKGEQAVFHESAISVGRAADNRLCLGDSARRVSSHHAEVIRRGEQFVLRDLGSTNGTMINGRRVMVSELEHDDLIEFGAGGPLLRFRVFHDTNRHQRELDRVGAAPVLEPKHHRSVTNLKGNATLIAALAVAMLLGGLGGIVASSRLRASDPDTLNFAEVAALNSPAVVFIRTEFELLDSSGQVTTTEARTGSGFIVSENGLIVTNRHLIRDWEYNKPPPGTTARLTKIEAILPHQRLEDAQPAEVYKIGDTLVDVAILKINLSGAPIVHGIKAGLSDINQGDEVVFIGYPLGLDLLEETRDKRVDPSLSPGIVSRVGHDYIQLTLRAYHGNSGGPVLNRRGEVIGILTGKVESAPDIALCLPISAALALVKDETK